MEAKISQKQREYFLMEQLKYIKKELGMEKDDKEALLTKFKDRIKDLTGPPTTATLTPFSHLLLEGGLIQSVPLV